MRNAFDDPKMLSMILHEKDWAGITSVAADVLAAQRSAAASLGLDMIKEQRSAGARLGLDIIKEQRSAGARLGLDIIKEQRSAGARIAADMFAVRSAGTSVHISDALAAATLANTSLAQMIHGAGGTVDWNKLAGGVSRDWLPEVDLAGTKMMAAATGVALESHVEWKGLLGGVSKDWLREMDLASSKMMAAATGVALKSHLINIADLSSQAEALVSSLLPDRLGLALSIFR